MKKNNSLYDFLNDLVANQDGSFDYDIKNRMLGKYNRKSELKAIWTRTTSILTSDKREAA